MNEPLLNDFNLGGGTNLAIKYDHRVSTDIDLFYPGVVGHSKMNEIKALLNEKYAEFDIQSIIRNNSVEFVLLESTPSLNIILSSYKLISIK